MYLLGIVELVVYLDVIGIEWNTCSQWRRRKLTVSDKVSSDAFFTFVTDGLVESPFHFNDAKMFKSVIDG